jgi:hypothetical protein
MATVTADHVYDFTGDQDPFSNASFTNQTVNAAKIVSGAYKASAADSARRIHRYTGAKFATSGTVSAEIELAAVTASDYAIVGIVDSTGKGYYLHHSGYAMAMFYTEDYGVTYHTGLGYDQTDMSFAANDELAISLTYGSPNTIRMYKNGVEVTPEVNGNTHTATLGSDVYLIIGLVPGNANGTTIGSLGLNNLASTTVKKLKLLVHSSAASATVDGIVFSYPTGGNLVGTEIGEFTSKQFDAALESGQARLKVPVADFGGTSLTTSDTPVVLVRNASNTTGLVQATVIEE